MRNYNDPARFEKETTTEPNKVGEQAPAVETDTSGWDSLKDVPFRGEQTAEEQEEQEELEQEM